MHLVACICTSVIQTLNVMDNSEMLNLYLSILLIYTSSQQLNTMLNCIEL